MNPTRLWRTADGTRRFWGHRDGWKRFWFYLFYPSGWEIKLEFGRVPRSRWLELEYGEWYVEGVQVSAGWGLGVWLTLVLPFRLRNRIPFWPAQGGSREWGLSWFAGDLRFKFGQDPIGDIGRRQVRLWRNEWVTGRAKHSQRVLWPPTPHMLNLMWWPGDLYDVKIGLEEHTWKKRFSTRSERCYTFSVSEGHKAPPVPGKGENSWDCGDDAIYGMAVSVDDVSGLEGAIDHFRKQVEEARLRYANRSWRPQPEEVVP